MSLKWKKLSQSILNPKRNPFNDTYEIAKKTGTILSDMISQHGLFNEFKINLIGYSLGTVIIFNLLIHLVETGYKEKVGDVILLGSCLEK